MKLLKWLSFSIVLLTSSSASARYFTVPEPDPVIADSLVSYAQKFIGTPYVWAGVSPSGFDCSGFVYYVFIHFGYTIQRSSSGLNTAGVKVNMDEVTKGDLILFTGTNPDDKSVGHVGIVISNKGEPLHFIHASSSKKHPGVVITDYANSHYPKRFVGLRRVLGL
jgi:peptidoglycan DL-endopeptidase CwlO